MSNISRSQYQKVCEENKRLLKDIRVLVREFSLNDHRADKILLIQKWREYFKENDKDFVRDLLKEYATNQPKQ